MTSNLPPSSRYFGLPSAVHEEPSGRRIVHLTRRFVPQPEQHVLIREHRLLQSDRLDTLAAQYFGDPELFWRLCDANRAIDPEMLTEQPGRRLRITLPAGLPGSADA